MVDVVLYPVLSILPLSEYLSNFVSREGSVKRLKPGFKVVDGSLKSLQRKCVLWPIVHMTSNQVWITDVLHGFCCCLE